MNRVLLVASLLAALMAGIHLVIGGSYIAAPLLESSLETEPRLVLYACWHGISAALALSAVGLFMGALPRFAEPSRVMVLAISIWWLAAGAIILALIATHPGDGLWWRLPQWMLLTPVGLLGLWAATRRRRAAPFP